MITLEKVNKVYSNGLHAVKDVSLKVNKGDIFGIIGLSGAGKSSLIRLINRLEEPTSGKIFINGENVLEFNKKQLLERRKKIGMIFQHFNLLSSRTVEENVAFALEIANWNKNEIKERVAMLLDIVGLSDKAKYYPSQLSGGQKQRVSIARALANNPDILLSDEATSALDPKTTKSILELIKKIQQKFSLTVVMITHQMEVVKEVCNRVAMLLDIVGLSDKAKYYPSQLSGGQKQRVSIARALANNPDILLSDEATSALDPKTTKSILELIKKIQEKFSLTVVMITHQMEVVKEVCNRVAIMSDGRIVEEGGVHHIFADPKNEITKELISYVHQQTDTEIDYLHHRGKKIVKVKFLGTSTQEPIISKVIKEYGIDISVLGGTIDKLATMNIGHLYLELDGDLSAQDKAIELMGTMDVIVEVIYNGY